MSSTTTKDKEIKLNHCKVRLALYGRHKANTTCDEDKQILKGMTIETNKILSKLKTAKG